MSSTEEVDADAPADREYFSTLEENFLRLRGTATLISAADWTIAAEWRRAGIPARHVVEVMAAVFARQRERRSKRGISSLRYFRAAVAASWQEQLELGAGGARPRVDPGPDLESRLRALAAAVATTPPVCARVRAQILELAGPLEEVERELSELDRQLVAEIALTLDDEESAALDERVARAAARVESGLGANESSELRARLRVRAVREAFGLPLLSLFSPAALGSAEPDES